MPIGNDVTERERIWRRFPGDDWAAFDALPLAVRQRIHEHAYNPWAGTVSFFVCCRS
jgi:hypothetical protein